MRASEKFMRMALDAAREYEGLTSPNPPVGAVIVRGGKVLAMGAHRYAGAMHAEAEAISKADKNALKGASLYVTLEPCSSWGRTPPCADAIINAGIKRVVIGMYDPNKSHYKKSLPLFKKSGIEVLIEDLEGEIQDFYLPYKTSMEQSRPFVCLKCAQTIDGKIAQADGYSKWITSKEARVFAHESLRYRFAGCLIGVNTVLQDDPRLTIRVGREMKSRRRIPFYRIVLDSNLRMPSHCRLVSTTNKNYPLIIFVNKTLSKKKEETFLKAVKQKARHISIIRISKQGHQGLNLKECLARLYSDFDIDRLLVEGGSSVFSAFIKEGLSDRIVFFIAPKILGKGVSTFDVEGFSLKRPYELIIKDIMLLNKDVIIDTYVYRNNSRNSQD